MRSLQAAFQTHLDTGLTTRAKIIKVTRRDETINRLADFDADISVSGDGTYSARSCTVGAHTWDHQGVSVDIDILVGGPSPVTEADVVKGLYDGATVEEWDVNWADTTQKEQLFTGFIGDIRHDDAGGFAFDIRHIAERSRFLKLRTFRPGCPWKFGQVGTCNVPVRPADVARTTAYTVGQFVRKSSDSTISGYGNRMFEVTTAGTTAAGAVAYDYTVGNATTDGTAVFTAREAWTRYATVASVTSQSKFSITITEPRAIDNWFSRGGGKWFSGLNNGRSFDIRKWTQAGAILELWEAQPNTIQVGDQMEIHVGDDLTRSMCHSRFDNLLHFGGIPYVNDQRFGGA